jgi:hypothetical protein
MADEHFLARLWARLESQRAEVAAGGFGALGQDLEPLRRSLISAAEGTAAAHRALLDGHDTKDTLAHRAADLWMTTMRLLAEADVTPVEVFAVLEGRERREEAGHHLS